MFKKASRILIAFLAVSMTIVSSGVVQADEARNPTTGVQVQNLSSTETAVNLRAVDKSGTTVNTASGFSSTIPGNNSKTFFPLDTIGVTSGFDGSLVVSSAQPVAAIANILATSTTGVPTGASYGGVSNPAASLTLPLIMKNNGSRVFDTVFNVQNGGSADVVVTVAYTPSDSSSGATGCQQTATIKPGAAATFDQGKDTNYTGCAGGNGLLGDDTKFIGSAQITTASGSIVAAALESNQLTLFAYTGFPQGTTNPVFPLINANNNGNQTGVQIANLGTQSTDVTVNYTPGTAGTACTEKQTVPAGGSATFALNAFVNNNLGAAENCADNARFIGSAIVSVNSTNQQLVAIINQLNNSKGLGAAYGSFDATTATDKVSLPLIVDNNGKFKGFTGYSIVNVGTAAATITCTYATVNGHTPAVEVGSNIAPGSALVVNNNTKLRKDDNTAYVGSANCEATPAGSKIVGVVNQTVGLSTAADGASAGDKLLVYEGFTKQ